MTIVFNKLQHSQIEQNSKTKLQSFQRKIYLKAKQNPKYKFYCLYDKVFRQDTLEEAYRKVKRNGGKGGADGIEFKDIKEEEIFINEIQEELKQKKYKPNQLRQVEIPKANGKVRILRIPTIKDKVVQMAVKLIIEPIFEADFKDCSYGYRPKRSAHQAIKVLDKELFPEIYKTENKRKQVKSIDLTDCFNTIPHKELIQIIARRIIDRQMLKLIKAMLKSEVMKEENGNDQNSENIGTPQGGVLSPLLANVYLDKIDEYWESKGKLSKMIRYADDIVIALHKREEQEYEKLLGYIERDLKLKVNKEKTKTENIKDGVKYLGFEMKEKTSRNHKQYLSIEPSDKSRKKIKEKIKGIIKSQTLVSTEDMVARANRVLKGWQQYFDNIAMGETRQQINWYAELRLAKVISKRNESKRIKWKMFKKGELHRKYGLYEMRNLGRIFAKM